MITVLRRGILDLSVFLLMTALSCTSQGDMSSMFLLFVVFRLFLMLLEDVPLKVFLFSLLLITLDRLPLLFIRDSVLLELLFFIKALFLFALDPERARLVAEMKI